MGLLDTNLSSAVTGIKNAVSSRLPNISALTKNTTTKLDTYNTPVSPDHNIGNYFYPQDLGVAPELVHWVTFYINVRGKSKIAQSDPSQLATGEPIKISENRLDPTTMDNAIIGKAAIGGAVSTLSIGKKLVTLAGKTVTTRSGSGIKGGVAAGAAAVGLLGVGAVAGATAATMTVKPDTTYRLKDAITLHVSQSPSTHYGAQYDTVDFGALGGFVAGGASYADTLNQSQQNQEAMLAAARAAMKGPAKLLTGAKDGGNAGALIEATTKQTLNPYREVLFKSVGFRKFAFDYRFFPKSKAETDTVQKIIKTFKYHMHPEMSAGRLYYIHPSEFNIQYYFKGKENTYMNKISTCVLVDMHVVYGPTEGFSTFGDGAPTEISMRLEFQELETLTKERIDDGY